MRFLTGDTHSDHDTICRFRRESFAAVAEAFARLLGRCMPFASRRSTLGRPRGWTDRPDAMPALPGKGRDAASAWLHVSSRAGLVRPIDAGVLYRAHPPRVVTLDLKRNVVDFWQVNDRATDGDAPERFELH